MEVKERQLKALGFSLTSFLLFLLSLYFLKIINIPMEEQLSMGVDLNYGVDLVGYGNLQTLNKANASKIEEEMAPSATEEIQSKTSTPKEVKTEPTSKTTKVIKSVPSKKVIVSEIDKTPIPSSKDISTNKSATTSSTNSSTKPTSTSSVPQRNVDDGSLFKKKGTASNSNGTVGTKTGTGGNNNGDGKPGNVGDQGSPEGTLDGKSLYGKPGNGGSGGASVNISGWKKRNFQLEKDNSSETGTIIFDVTVDDLGEVKSIITVRSDVSPSVAQFYKSYIQSKLSSFLVPEGTPPSRATGRIIINLKSGN